MSGAYLPQASLWVPAPRYYGGEPKEALRKRTQTIGEEMIAKYKEAHGE